MRVRAIEAKGISSSRSLNVNASLARLGWPGPGNIHNFFKDLFRNNYRLPVQIAEHGHALRPGPGSNAYFFRPSGEEEQWRVGSILTRRQGTTPSCAPAPR